MSLPINLLRWVGDWDVAATYWEYDVVLDTAVMNQFVFVGRSGTNTLTAPNLNPAEWIPYPVVSSGVTSINGLVGAVTLVDGGNMTITPNNPFPNQISLATTTPSGVFTPSYAEFVSNTTQALPATVQTPITFDAKNSGTFDIITFGALPSSSIQINTTGFYRCIFSVQLEKSGGGGTNEFQFWFTKNGVAIPNSNSKVDESQQINSVMTVETFIPIVAGNTIGVTGYTIVGSVNCFILAKPIDATHPVSIPSIILNIQRIA